MKSSEIRQKFIDYFKERGHQPVEASPLVPADDPTLLFTNAGMVQFKQVFLGSEKRSYQRAVTSQPCVRAGGKHNDLENVGYTARHHTFFEMLGNFSFGDYFKRDAIRYAWDFLTKVLGLPQERLWVTVFRDDDETADIWLREMGVSPERFSRCGEKDNFWSMGDTGPCGPCTEIFYDHGSEIAGGPPGSPDADGDRYIEIWNLVFMQFNRDKEGRLHPLPKPSVDTGMGLERISAVVQGVHNNYDIDSFKDLIEAVITLKPEVDKEHPSLRVIADHLRACSFLIADGILPGNEGRGYVLRRIIRRAVRHGNKLGLSSPFFSRLVAPLCEIMGEAYPKIVTLQAQIERILEQEENQFARTLEQGLRLLQDEISALADAEIPGAIAFKLYDTYGFPLDLTQDIAREQQLRVDVEGFDECMRQQRLQSQAASQFSTDYHSSCPLEECSAFHGYQLQSMMSSINALVHNGKKVNSLNAGEEAAIVLLDTPFYAESGGQVGDSGVIETADARFIVTDTKKQGQAIVHYGYLERGMLKVDEQVSAKIDNERRAAIRLNHTATHLLHAALQEIVGSHVQQKGSLVAPDRARFDFAHFESVTVPQLRAIEDRVNAQIRANEDVVTTIMALDEAKKSGAVALFGEKYSDEVRVLTIGDFSKELCGGTHASRTGDIGLFKIIAEYGVASGVRRIEMVTGAYALAWVQEQLENLDELALKLKTNPANANEKLTQLLKDSRAQEKELQRLQMQLTAKESGGLAQAAEVIADVKVLIQEMDNSDSQALRATMDQLRSSLDKAVIVLYTCQGEKLNVIAGLSKSLVGRAPGAAELVRLLCGKGGGRDDMAQGGGVMPSDLPGRLHELRELLRVTLNAGRG